MKTSSLIHIGARSCTIIAATLALSLLALGSSARAQTVLYTNNDGSTGTFSGGATGTAAGGTQSTSPSGESFREVFQGNSTFTLMLMGLSPNSAVTLSLNLYAIRTLDGNGPAGGNSASTPDLFSITATSGTLLNASFANYSGDTQTYPSMYTGPTGIVNNAPGMGSSAENTLGYGGGTIGDSTYGLSYSAVADANGSLVLTFTGQTNQAENDESFGFDNLSVRGTAVPEPSTWAMIALGGAFLVGLMRYRAGV